MRIGVLGINHKLAGLRLRELLAQACQRFFVTAGSNHGSHTFILLNTCNRTEIYFASQNLAETHSYLLQMLRLEVQGDFDQKVYSYFGQDCFLHLARVTAGLDSAIVAETEIQGQVKTAYENAANCIALPREMHYLFQKSLKIGKDVRSKLSLGRGVPDLEHAIYQTGAHFFNNSQNAKILFVGASEVNCKVLQFLKTRTHFEITLCNRSQPRLHALAAEYQVKTLEWKNLSHWFHYDWIICGTKSPHALITDCPPSDCTMKLVMDLSVPRNVDPRLGKDSKVTLLNIDQINRILKVRRERMMHSLTQAEYLVTAAAKNYHNYFQRKSIKIA